MGNRYVPGDWNALCDVCGFEYKASELLDRWDGNKVCKQDWEPRHVLDFFRPLVDHTEVPWSREDSALSSYFVINVTVSTVLTGAALATALYSLVIDATAGNIILTLPLTSVTQLSEFRRVNIARVDSTLNTVTLAVQAPDTFVGSTTVAISDIFELIVSPTKWTRQ